MSVDNPVGNHPELSVAELTQVLQPIEMARGLPNACYTDNDVHNFERDRVFSQGWACAGFAIDAPNKGDLYPFEFAGLPLLLMRALDSTLRKIATLLKACSAAANHPALTAENFRR